MASYTTNLNLKKPAGSENVAIGDINNNMDTIDQAYGTLNSNITPSTVTLTIGSKLTLSLSNCKRIGKLCIFTFFATTTSALSPDDTVCTFTGITANGRYDFHIPSSDGNKLFYLANSGNELKANAACATGVQIAISGCFVIN